MAAVLRRGYARRRFALEERPSNATTVFLSVTWGLVLAWAVSLAFYQTMRHLGY